MSSALKQLACLVTGCLLLTQIEAFEYSSKTITTKMILDEWEAAKAMRPSVHYLSTTNAKRAPGPNGPFSDALSYTLEFNYRAGEGWSVLEESRNVQEEQKQISKSVRVANRVYSAGLALTGPDKYSLNRFQESDGGKPGPTSFSDHLPWTSIADLNLGELLKSPGIFIGRIENRPPDTQGGPVARVHFQARKTTDGKRIPQDFDHGFVDMLVDARFAPVYCEWTSKNPKVTAFDKGSNQYTSLENGPLLVRQSSQSDVTSKTAKGNFSIQSDNQFEALEKPANPATFMLGHYGLPEPESIAWERTVRQRIWIATGVGVGLAIAACGGYWWYARRKVSPPQP